ncbi:CDP-6-deoxy-D-xylo-4-hexulose-3-dehydrase [Peptoclostridium litorale DSM 5388]|uniref:Lipopolysaccharide biosynthesis protein RfbH n=1 Tax=Peptoclostridium litorale DSM 5388 TaxID=1121324 RepID=A0A069RKJ2_PEPLI|nr:lipopolysaccharide biosynthesis protein RfbH [Peptoclostridium litorale]KDR96625.1 lipopolysaccharide biosynthesis protein RfbH [Peptoclostridium litorale DSM 5388]SIN68329.1 CDP-6-deoxy-D-xylo-4-hexulose-3-dehydrase [Peptoclostridium litorale DSM 5388]
MGNRDKSEIIKHEIFDKVKEFLEEKSKSQEFIPGKTNLQYAGAVYDHNEINAMLESILDGWFGLSKKALEFEKALAQYLGVGEVILTNSGSSANLLSISALTSKRLGKSHLQKGDEIIIAATGFPSTLNPIIQNGLVPVFVDCEPVTYNLDADKIEAAISEKTRGIMIAHTLGFPADMEKIMDIANRHDLFVVEDACDALGSSINGKPVGTFGTAGTFSFYVAHQMTTGEGGAIVTNDKNLARIIRSFRDWGRACVCQPCKVFMNPNFNCPARFNHHSKILNAANSISSGSMIDEYDRRYTYIEIGYNLKPLEFQAAMGIEQLKRLPDLITSRQSNFNKLYKYFEKWKDYFILPKRGNEKYDICWFGFPLTLRDNAPFKRIDLIEFLKDNMIETRLLFAGNFLKQPAYADIECRIFGDIVNSNTAMDKTFFFGTYKGITDEMMDYIFNTVDKFMRNICEIK